MPLEDGSTASLEIGSRGRDSLRNGLASIEAGERSDEDRCAQMTYRQVAAARCESMRYGMRRGLLAGVWIATVAVGGLAAVVIFLYSIARHH